MLSPELEAEVFPRPVIQSQPSQMMGLGFYEDSRAEKVGVAEET